MGRYRILVEDDSGVVVQLVTDAYVILHEEAGQIALTGRGNFAAGLGAVLARVIEFAGSRVRR